MKKTPQFRADRLAWRFRKSGDDGQLTKPYAEFTKKQQQTLLEQAGLENGEIPALAHLDEAARWMLVTSDRVIWKNAGEPKQSIMLDDLTDATVEPKSLLLARGKGALCELKLVTRASGDFLVYCESGPPFSAMWNALKMAAAWGAE